MPDYRLIGQIVEYLPPLPADHEWTRRWNERGESVRSVLGETVDPGMVHSFSWKDYLLPGACAMTFKSSQGSEDGLLYMTLGLTQPLLPGASAFPWEFSVRSRQRAEWPVDLLYQLLSQWLWEKGDMWFGSHLPLWFFVGGDGKLWTSVSERVPLREPVGDIRGMYLWRDASNIRFTTSTGDFGLLTVVGVTADEERLANAATPAHLVLLLRRMGVIWSCDPHRRSVFTLPGANDEWCRIERMSEDEVLDALQRMS